MSKTDDDNSAIYLLLVVMGIAFLVISVPKAIDFLKDYFNKAKTEAKTEAYARGVARGGNSDVAKKYIANDDMTVSMFAYADGKTVFYDSVLAFRSDVTKEEIIMWRNSIRTELFPFACAGFAQDHFFQSKGLQMHYRYSDRNDRLLYDLLVSRDTCDGKKEPSTMFK